MKDYVEVGRFFHMEQMTACVSTLKAQGLTVKAANDSPTTNLSVLTPGAVSCGIVLVKSDQLIAAREALLNAAREEIASGIDPDHPLTSFSEDELIDLLKHPWEHTGYELAFAEQLLKECGIAPPVIVFQKAEPCSQVILPEGGVRKGPRTLLLLAILTAATGGILGLIMAWNLAYSTEEKTDGSRRFVYDESTRSKGRILFVFAGLMFLCTMFFLILEVADRLGIY